MRGEDGVTAGVPTASGTHQGLGLCREEGGAEDTPPLLPGSRQARPQLLWVRSPRHQARKASEINSCSRRRRW